LKSFALAAGLVALAQPSLWATAQRGELLEYDGEQVEIFTTPLESYFNDDRKRLEFPPASTALWRGYIGKWRENGEGRSWGKCSKSHKPWIGNC
jgi:hypothetical protein